MHFDLGDDAIESLLEELEEWATQTVRTAEEQAQKLDVTPQYYSPHDFWADNLHNNNSQAVAAAAEWAEPEDASPVPHHHHHQQQPDDTQFTILKARSDACDALLGHVDRALSDLDAIESQHKLVSEKTHTLHDMCKRLLAEQTRLDKVVLGIQTPMSYFMSLDDISPRFGLPVIGGGAATPKPSSTKLVVLHPDDEQFKRDLARLDECLHFVHAHAHYHDAHEYGAKFTQVQLHGLRMIETWVAQEIGRLDKQQPPPPSASRSSSSSFLDDSALYFRFVEKGKVLRPSVMELEKRPKIAYEVVHSLLSQLCDVRLRLLRASVSSAPEIATNNNNNNNNSIVSRILVGSEFLGRVCVAEHAVVSSFFSLAAVKHIFAQHHQQRRVHDRQQQQAGAGSRGRRASMDDEHDDDDDDEALGQHLSSSLHHSNAFFALLEQLCTCLFDSVRPLVVKEHDLDVLCDASSAVESAIQELDARMDADASEPLVLVLTRIALDLQERICFCVVRIVREDISPLKSRAAQQWLAQYGGATPTSGWFPSLEITLSTLSKVYRTVDSNVFEQLATEAVSACTQALCDAARAVQAKQQQRGVPTASAAAAADEADLFLVQHLLILREQISPFRAVLASKERRIDYTPTSRALATLLQFKRPSGFLNLLRFAGPSIQETDLNSKRELDQSLRRASESYILRVSKRALGPLLEFVDASQAYLQREDATWDGLCAQDFAALPQVLLAVKYCEDNMAREIGAARQLALQFLANAQTRGVLFHAIETNAFKIVTTAANFAQDMFKEEGSDGGEKGCNDRLRELVRVAGALKSSSSQSVETASSSSSVA